METIRNLCFLLCLIRVSCLNVMNSKENYSESEDINKCLVKLTKALSLNPIIISNNYSQANNVLNEIAVAFHKNNIPHSVANGVLEVVNITEEIEGEYFIIFIDNCEVIDKLNYYVKPKKYVILTYDFDQCGKEIVSFGQKNAEFDILIIRKISRIEFEVLTYIPYLDDDSCELIFDVPPKTLNICDKDTENLNRNEIYLRKHPANYKKCSFNVGVANVYPFAKTDKSQEPETMTALSVSKIGGSDVEIAKIFSDYMNASVNWYYIFTDEENPYLHKEFVVFFQNGSLDICIGGLYRIYGDAVAYSGIYNRQSDFWTYAVYRDNRNWMSLIRNIHGLYIFLAFYLTFSIIWYLISKYDENCVPLTDILIYNWGALIGGGSLRIGSSMKQKLLNVMYLYMCIHYSAYISVTLYSFLTIQGPPEMFKTNDDVMASGRTAYLHSTRKYFIEESKYLAFASTSKDCDNFMDCQRKVVDNNGVTVTVDGAYVLFQTATAANDEARIMRARDNIVTVYHEMLIRRDSSIVDSYQKFLRRLFEAGICDQLLKEAIGLTLVDKSESVTKNIMANSYSCEEGCSITLSQTAGVFYVWAFGCILSCTVFTFELFLGHTRTGDRKGHEAN